MLNECPNVFTAPRVTGMGTSRAGSGPGAEALRHHVAVGDDVVPPSGGRAGEELLLHRARDRIVEIIGGAGACARRHLLDARISIGSNADLDAI